MYRATIPSMTTSSMPITPGSSVDMVVAGRGEPCDSQNRPYFRPGNDVTRGQLSKMVSTAFGYSDPVTTQTFEDVPPANAFYIWVERIAARGIIGGYPCGTTPSEPCIGPDNRPYFRPNNNITRGQAAKIIDGAREAQPTPTPSVAPTSTSTSVPTGTAIATATETATAMVSAIPAFRP